MGILLCEQNFRDVWRRNKSVRAEIGKILRTHTRGSISSKDTWLQSSLSGSLSRYFLVGHGIICLLYFLLLGVVAMWYALSDVLAIVNSSSRIVILIIQHYDVVFSGPKRYDFNEGAWIYKHDGVSLHTTLTTEVSSMLGQPLSFMDCAYATRRKSDSS